MCIRDRRQEGLEKLKDKQVAEVLNGTANSKNLQYRVDYNLGDLCTCINQQIGKLTDKRIVEVKEVFEDGNVEICLLYTSARRCTSRKTAPLTKPLHR